MTLAKRTGLTMLVLGLWLAPQAHADVVVSAGVVKTFDKSGLRQAWTRGRVDGARVVMVDVPEGAAPRQAFYQAVFGFADEKKIRNYWIREMFTGDAAMPVVQPDEAAVHAYLRAHPAAIGYLRQLPADAGDLHVLFEY